MLPYKRGAGSGVSYSKEREDHSIKNYGMAELEKQAGNICYQFQTGFVSKAFTAAAVLQLKEQGKLNLT